MQKYVKVYLSFFGYGEQDFVPCELCGQRAADIHHLLSRSRGGKDNIENLIALCRLHHTEAHTRKEFNEQLKELHQKKISK